MSAIHGWVTDYGAKLGEIADESGVVPDIVHLAAVMVLAGFTDAQIREQLDVLEVRLRDGSDPLAGLIRALPLIRELATVINDGPTDPPGGSPHPAPDH